MWYMFCVFALCASYNIYRPCMWHMFSVCASYNTLRPYMWYMICMFAVLCCKYTAHRDYLYIHSACFIQHARTIYVEYDVNILLCALHATYRDYVCVIWCVVSHFAPHTTRKDYICGIWYMRSLCAHHATRRDYISIV